jgi:hypothetical protein
MKTETEITRQFIRLNCFLKKISGFANKRSFIIGGLSLLAAVSGFAAATPQKDSPRCLIDSNFSKSVSSKPQGTKGSFSGVLPAGWQENFAAWTRSVARTKLMNSDGEKFLRFTVEKLAPAVQFRIPVPMDRVVTPWSYKLRIKYWAESEGAIGLRLMDRPYNFCWRTSLPASEAWQEKTITFPLTDKVKQRIGLYFYPGPGNTDIAFIKLERTVNNEVRSLSFRPDKNAANFFRNSRFPLGLQSGWNFINICQGRASAAPDVPGPSGCPSLKLEPVKGYSSLALCSEPFQSGNPEDKNYLAFACKGKGKWQLLIRENGKTKKSINFTAGNTWKRVIFSFNADPSAYAYSFRLTGSNVLYLDSLQAWAGNPDRKYASAGECEIALAPAKSEISQARIQFEDEPSQIKYCITGNYKNSVIKSTLTNVYGRTTKLPDLKPDRASGKIDFGAALSDTPYGQFRIECHVERNGKRVSPYNEIVITRLKRPRHWNEDAPASQFGFHFLPIDRIIKTMKACGVNWVRIHDSGIKCTGWYYLEPRKGQWKFNDDLINLYRRNHIKLFAQLGTAPPWASYYEKSMKNDVHSKYFMPKNPDDFAEYVKVVVGRYRGVIDDYFVWNEPYNKNFFAVSYDPKKKTYRQSEHPAQDYVKLLKAAYETARKTDPQVKITGFSTHGNPDHPWHPGSWTKPVVAAGGLKYVDAVDFHNYDPYLCGFPNDSITKRYQEAVGCIFEKYPNFSKPIYFTEGQVLSEGTSHKMSDMTGMYHHTITWKSADDFTTKSDRMCRLTLSLLSMKNLKRVFLYSTHTYVDICAKPYLLTLLSSDGYPHPSLAAFANFTWQLEGGKFVKTVTLKKGVYAYIFGNTDETVAVISGNAGIKYRLLAVKEAAVSDLFGNPVRGTAEYKGKLIFIRAPLSPEALEKQLTTK